MCMHNNIEAVDRTLKDLMYSNMSFIDKAILFLGDFRKILRVVPRGFGAFISASCFKRNPIFPLLKQLRLTRNMTLLALQQNTDANEKAIAFPKVLLNVGNGSLPQNEDRRTKNPSSINKKNTIQNLSRAVFSRLHQIYESTAWLISRATITCKSRFLSDINETVMESFPGEAREHLCCGTV